MHSTFWTTRGEKRKTGDAITSTIDQIRLNFGNFSNKFLSTCRSPIGDFRQNFSTQIFFPLAMATKMVAA